MATANRTSNRSPCSGVVIEQPTETLVPTHSTDAPFRRLAVNQFVVQSLMIPLAMVVGDKFRDRPSMVALAEQNQAVQTFLFDQADEPFGIGDGVGRSIRCLDDANPRVLQAPAPPYSTWHRGRRSAREEPRALRWPVNDCTDPCEQPGFRPRRNV
jgi:hypothetical protein